MDIYIQYGASKTNKNISKSEKRENQIHRVQSALNGTSLV